MTSEKKKKIFPTILSKLKAMNLNSSHAGSNSNESREDGLRSRTEPRVTPKLAWVSRKESNASTLSLSMNGGVNGGGGDTPKQFGLSRVPSSTSLGGVNSAWGKRQKKKREAEEYAAAKLARQKEEMVLFYRGTPMTDDKATSSEILKFLYEMWEPQLCASYRPDVKITSTCRQDMRSSRRIVQTTPRRIAKLHRARLIIDTCVRMGSSSNLHGDNRTTLSRPGSSRPRSAKSIT